MRVFLTKQFARFARREGVSVATLRAAITRAEKGLVDADLGGGLIKQRVARTGQGRSGGYRTVLAFQRLGRAIFLYGFAKSERENISADDLARLKKLAIIYLGASWTELERGCAEGELQEITDDQET